MIEYCYILAKYHFYDCDKILLISSSYDEIMMYFFREFRKFNNNEGLAITRYKFGKYDTEKHIKWIEKEDNKIREI